LGALKRILTVIFGIKFHFPRYR